jgi:outer membrane protein TolC
LQQNLKSQDMIRQFFIMMMCIATAQIGQAQSLTLQDCKQLAHDNYPAIKQYDLIAQTRDYTIENAAKSWLPQISATINGLAFTDVLDVSSQMQQAGLSMHKQMAAGNIMINQTIYDGGRIKAGKQVTAAQAEVQKQQLDVSLYDLNQRIEQLYFGILTIDEQMKQTRLLQSDLALSSKSITSMIKGGIANQTDLDAVNVEQVKSQQTLDAQQSSRAAYLQMLGYFIGKKLGDATTLQTPATTLSDAGNRTESGLGSTTDDNILRPELSYYTAQSKLTEAQQKQLDSKLLPTISAFGMGMYHTTVSDMMKNGMLAGGVTLSWNIGALYTRKNDLKKLEIQRQQIESQRSTFLFNNHLQDESTNGNIVTLRKQLAQDDKIVSLRERIRSMSEKKVQLGTESVNEMLRDINAVSEARQQQALHQIQLIKEIYAQKTNKGL